MSHDGLCPPRRSRRLGVLELLAFEFALLASWSFGVGYRAPGGLLWTLAVSSVTGPLLVALVRLVRLIRRADTAQIHRVHRVRPVARGFRR